VRFGERYRGESRTMLLGHLDTVWALGTLARMPFEPHATAFPGPGVLDMKAGVVMALTAVESAPADETSAPSGNACSFMETKRLAVPLRAC